MNKYLKEIVFLALFIAVVILMIGILFYEFVPNQIIPEATKYKQSSSTAKLISQIEEEQQTDEKEDSKESVLKSYEVTSDDLDISQDESRYVKGKNHPFYDYTKATTSTNTTSGTSSNASSSITESGTNTTTNEVSLENNSNSVNTTNTSNTSTNKINTNSLRDTSETNKTSK